MLTKRLVLSAVVFAALTPAVAAAGSVRIASDAVHRLEHDSGVPWVALNDGPSTGTGYQLPPGRTPPHRAGSPPARTRLTAQVMRFFTAYGAIFQMVDPPHELKVYARGGGQGAQAAFFTQVEGGVPVNDTGISIEFDGDGRIETITGSFVPHLHGVFTVHTRSRRQPPAPSHVSTWRAAFPASTTRPTKIRPHRSSALRSSLTRRASRTGSRWTTPRLPPPCTTSWMRAPARSFPSRPEPRSPCSSESPRRAPVSHSPIASASAVARKSLGTSGRFSRASGRATNGSSTRARRGSFARISPSPRTRGSRRRTASRASSTCSIVSGAVVASPGS